MRTLALALVRAATGRELADAIAGDLEELRRARAVRSSFFAAAWSFGASMAIAVVAGGSRLRSAIARVLRGGFGWQRAPVELRYAVRSLRRSPWYACTVIGVVALALALATTVFAVVDGVLFKPLPYAHAGELYQLSGDFSEEALRKTKVLMAGSRFLLSVRDVDDLSAAVPGAQFTMYSSSGAGLLGDPRSWIPITGDVDAHFFEVLGVSPLTGGFTPQDFEGPRGAVVPAIVSHGLWQSQLAGRLDVIGRTIAPAGGTGTPAYRVVGIMPANFVFPTSGANPPNLLLPLSTTAASRADRRNKIAYAIARVPPSVPLAVAQERVNASAKAGALETFDPRRNAGLGYADNIRMRPLDTDLRGVQRPTLWTIFGAALALVLLACANISGLIASRSVDRVRELTLRRALGAGTRHIAALVVAECAVLITAGTVAGILLARPTLTLALRLLPPNLGLLKTPALDWRVAIFAVAATAASICLAAIWPVVQGVRVRLSPAMSTGGNAVSASRSIGRQIIIGVQTALGLALTLGGTLFVGSLIQVWRTDVGFSPAPLLVIDGGVVAGPAASDRTTALAGFLDAVREIPGVASAGATSAQLLRRSSPGGMFRGGSTYRISSGFFEAMQMRVVEGRAPTASELDAGAPVVAISERVARSLFPGAAAVGQTLTSPAGQSYTVTGVVSDVRVGSWDTEGTFGGEIYTGFAGSGSFTAVVRTITDASVLPAVIQVAQSRGAAIRLTNAATADDLLVDTIRQRRFQSWLFGSFGTAALAIVGVGILGLIAMATARRTREVGIRMVLGAPGDAVVRLLIREQLLGVLVGLAGGGLVSAWAVKFVRSYLYQLTATDPRVWAVAAGLILVTALLGVLVPSVRASRIDPVGALRVD